MDSIRDSVFKFLRIDHLVDNVSGYVEARVELLKIEIREDVAKVLARGMMVIVILLMSLLFLLFFSVGLAHFINSYFEAEYIGYWIVSGIYGIPCLIFIAFRKQIGQSIEKTMMDLIKRKEK
jgi:uncharacterized membrane protein YqjE